MSSPILVSLLILIAHGVLAAGREREEIGFDQNYEVIWGGSFVVPLNQGKEIQLTMDNSSGSGVGSKMNYGSGFLHIRIKVSGGDSAGVVTAYYLISQGSRRDEIDFELLGNRKGKPYTLQTNIYADGNGNKEQRLQIWFDPTQDFHYRILWNQNQIVFFVDSIPIRVYKNKNNVGVSYPSKPMQIQATLWDGSSWTSDGGQSKVNWSYAPFKANFQGFAVSGCQVQSSYTQHHASDKYWWNSQKFSQLDPVQERQYDSIKPSFDNSKKIAAPLLCITAITKLKNLTSN